MRSDWFLRTFTPEASNEGGQGKTAALVLISVLGLLLAGTALFDIWADLVEERPLWSTLIENLLPLLIAIGLPYAAWRLSPTLRPRRLWSAAKWTLSGWGAALLFGGIILGVQVLQGELKPRLLIVQIASGGAAAGFLIGLTLVELKKTWGKAEREKLFESLKQSVLEGIVIAGEERQITDWNRGAKEIFGYDREEMVGRPIETLLTGRHRASFLEGLNRLSLAQEDQSQGETFELVGQTKNGEEFPVEISLSSWETDVERCYAAIIRDITDRRQMQREILRIQEEERRRLGQDLHDGIASHLTGASLKLQALSRRVFSDEVKASAEEVQELIQEGAEDVRRLSRGLDPAGLSAGDLPAALEELAQNTEGARFKSERSGSVEVEGEESEGTDVEAEDALTEASTKKTPEEPGKETATKELSEGEIDTHLYRIAQEAVANARRHGNADAIDICLKHEDSTLLLEVKDDGTGFDSDRIDEEGLGLRSMRHRAELLGTELEIESSPGEGTLVRCWLPL